MACAGHRTQELPWTSGIHEGVIGEFFWDDRKEVIWGFWVFLRFIYFYFFNFILFLNLKHCISFAKHQNESATGIKIWTDAPLYLPFSLLFIYSYISELPIDCFYFAFRINFTVPQVKVFRIQCSVFVCMFFFFLP